MVITIIWAAAIFEHPPRKSRHLHRRDLPLLSLSLLLRATLVRAAISMYPVTYVDAHNSYEDRGMDGRPDSSPPRGASVMDGSSDISNALYYEAAGVDAIP
jgi:hypothetical protein